jgi:hypothetical protein
VGDALVTAALLAAVAISESVRRLPAGALVLRRDALAPWKLARTTELGRGLHLLAWFVPFTLPVVLPDAAESQLGLRRLAKRLDARTRRVSGELAVMRVLGLLVLVLLVTIPFAILRSGAWGLLVGLALLIGLSMTQSALAWTALRRTGLTAIPALRASARFVWPFSAPQAPVAVQERLTSGMPALLAAYRMMGEAEFLSAFRHLVYDTVNGGASVESAELVTRICGRQRLVAYLATPPSLTHSAESEARLPFCPRCATVYRAGLTECADCSGVPLTTA